MINDDLKLRGDVAIVLKDKDGKVGPVTTAVPCKKGE